MSKIYLEGVLLENNRGSLIEIINQLKEEVECLKEGYLEDKGTLEKVNNLTTQLKEIEKVLKPKQKDIKEKIKKLDGILEELSEIKFDIILEQIDEIYRNIDKNLLDGMNLSKDQYNSGQIIVFENEKVGKIELLEEYRPQIRILVTIYDKREEFEVNDPIRIYNIISFVNTNFNYK